MPQEFHSQLDSIRADLSAIVKEHSEYTRPLLFHIAKEVERFNEKFDRLDDKTELHSKALSAMDERNKLQGKQQGAIWGAILGGVVSTLVGIFLHLLRTFRGS